MHDGPSSQPTWTSGRIVERFQQRIEALPPGQVHRHTFLTTYQQTTQAVGDAVEAACFEDPDWVVRWDVAFADMFIVAHDADQVGATVAIGVPSRSGASDHRPLALGHERAHQL